MKQGQETNQIWTQEAGTEWHTQQNPDTIDIMGVTVWRYINYSQFLFIPTFDYISNDYVNMWT